MNLGKLIRMRRIFTHPSGRFLSIAFDHFIGYGAGLPEGLRTIGPTLKRIVDGQPDAVTLHKGLARAAWEPYAGQIPLIIQSTIARPDDSACEQIAEPEEAVRLGADAFAVTMFVRGPSEAAHIRTVAQAVRQAAQFDLPVIVHAYSRDYSSGEVRVSTLPEDIAWAVRCAVEAGADVVKTPYCGDVAAYRQIVEDCPVPLVAAGGPKTPTVEAALQMMSDVVAADARGATVGRNVWGQVKVKEMILALKAVIHDGARPAEALECYGL
ncbi:MAG: aldolase [Syntrophothermus sp.]|uniref:class I fructose-bisphosphate aldolase n=1 Tax=Syntrophothermus sp. TaxID=2736299 RepID=UPI00257EC3CC|nr:hypothetical protein [Syntrophothermus sp.]NSW83158.1 aldolase [Syntrophothermus sp.]